MLFRAQVALVGVIAIGACSGETPSQIDANPAGPRCSMQVYDLCNEEHDCTSNLCQNFGTEGFQVCTQGCSANDPCPDDKTGAPGTCDGVICRPSVPNMCHL